MEIFNPRAIAAEMLKRGLIVPPKCQARALSKAEQRERRLARQRLAMARLRQKQRTAALAAAVNGGVA